MKNSNYSSNPQSVSPFELQWKVDIPVTTNDEVSPSSSMSPKCSIPNPKTNSATQYVPIADPLWSTAVRLYTAPHPQPQSLGHVCYDWNRVVAVDAVTNEGSDRPSECPICLESALKCPRIALCGHFFCWQCILEYFRVPRPVKKGEVEILDPVVLPCPVCGDDIVKGDLRTVRLQHNSPKVDVLGDLRTHKSFFVLKLTTQLTPTTQSEPFSEPFSVDGVDPITPVQPAKDVKSLLGPQYCHLFAQSMVESDPLKLKTLDYQIGVVTNELSVLCRLLDFDYDCLLSELSEDVLSGVSAFGDVSTYCEYIDFSVPTHLFNVEVGRVYKQWASDMSLINGDEEMSQMAQINDGREGHETEMEDPEACVEEEGARPLIDDEVMECLDDSEFDSFGPPSDTSSSPSSPSSLALQHPTASQSRQIYYNSTFKPNYQLSTGELVFLSPKSVEQLLNSVDNDPLLLPPVVMLGDNNSIPYNVLTVYKGPHNRKLTMLTSPQPLCEGARVSLIEVQFLQGHYVRGPTFREYNEEMKGRRAFFAAERKRRRRNDKLYELRASEASKLIESNLFCYKSAIESHNMNPFGLRNLSDATPSDFPSIAPSPSSIASSWGAIDSPVGVHSSQSQSGPTEQRPTPSVNYRKIIKTKTDDFPAL